MKKILLLTFVSISILATAQTPPVAVDDSVYIQNIYIANQDTATINPNDLTKNDTSFTGTYLRVEAIIYNGSNYMSPVIQSGNIVGVSFYTGSNFAMRDTFQYVVKDQSVPNLTDTATAYIIVLRKSHETLDANNINATIDKNVLFTHPDGRILGFEVPKNSGSSSIFAANLWVVGKRNANIVGNVRKFGGQTSYGNSMFSSNNGPVSDFSQTDSLVNSKWDRVWKVKQYEIDFHQANFTSANYNPPQSILDWPAHGDTTIGEAYYLAPFVDFDNDGHYNPYNGDYPKIKGDQAVFFIYNDGFSNFSIEAMGSEIQGMAYAFQCQDSALQNTIFVDYKIINRSSNTYTDTYLGMWSDMDLGNGHDDFVQCDVNRSLYFTLNGDAYDDDASGRIGYHDNLPAQGLMILKGAKQDDDGQDNAFGIGMNESVNGTGFGDGVADNEYWGMVGFQYSTNNGGQIFQDPRLGQEYYYHLQNYWLDYTHLVYGGMGHQNSPGATTTSTSFAFPGASDTYNYGTGGIAMPPWSEVTAMNTASDRRGTSISGPITFAPGDEVELTYAFIFGRDYVNTGVQAGVTNLLERADSIRSYYNQGILAACGFPVSVKEPNAVKNDMLIYPNPTNDVINIRQEKANSITIQILDITGKVVFNTSSTQQLNTVDLSGFSKGIYLVKVNSGGKISVEKLIKN